MRLMHFTPVEHNVVLKRLFVPELLTAREALERFRFATLVLLVVVERGLVLVRFGARGTNESSFWKKATLLRPLDRAGAGSLKTASQALQHKTTSRKLY